MKKTRKLATWRCIVRLTLSVLCILIALFVFGTAVDFALKSIDIQNAEMKGYSITYTPNGPVTWTKDQQETYNSAVKAKEALIATNDVAKFFSDMAGSTTGKIFRVIVPLLMVAWGLYSGLFARWTAGILRRRFNRWATKIAYPILLCWNESFHKWRKAFGAKVKDYLSQEVAKFRKKGSNDVTAERTK